MIRFYFIIFLVSICNSCKNDPLTVGGINESQNFIGGPNDPRELLFHAHLESYSFISSNNQTQLTELGEMHCALLEPVNFETKIDGCIDRFGNGTVTMECVPEIFNFPDLEEIPPDLEPQECQIVIENNGLQVIDESGAIIYDGPFIDEPFDFVDKGWPTFIESVAIQIHELENETINRGGQIIENGSEIRILRTPANNAEPESIITYNTTYNHILSKMTFDENSKMDYSIYYRYGNTDSEGKPVLSNMTERVRFKLDKFPDIPLIKENYYILHEFELKIN